MSYNDVQNEQWTEELREMIREKRIAIVVGSGVSKSTNPAASMWTDLVASGIDRCEGMGMSTEECDFFRAGIRLGKLTTLLPAAEAVHQKLSLNGGGELTAWLRSHFEKLEPLPDRTAVIGALFTLNAPLATTNYDELVEKVTGLGHTTWQQENAAIRVIRGEDRRVLHLHGFWGEPKSVVLGVKSYLTVAEDNHTQAVMRSLGVTRSLLFVGCGEDGLADPNWGPFIKWLADFNIRGGHELRHFRLVRQSEWFEPVGRLFPLVYGKEHTDLSVFLQSLVPEFPDTPAEKLLQMVVSTSPASVSAYLQRLEEHTKTLQMLGLGRSMQVELPIAEAYVPLRTELQRSLEGRRTERLSKGDADALEMPSRENVDLNEVFRLAEEFEQRGVVLLGEPGAGKTTGARQLAWRLASKQKLPQDLGLPAGITPVLLKFREMSREVLTRKKRGLEQFLIEQTHCPDAAEGLKNPGPDLWNAPGGLLWILDGLDEIVDPDVRAKVSGWIQRALRNRPNDRFLVTCRFQGYFRDENIPLGASFAEFHVRALTEQQVERFVTDWFAAAYRKLSLTADSATNRSQRLLEILKRPRYQTGRMAELSQNPLLLTILCVVFHDQRELPTERAELYSECIRILLQHFRRELYAEPDRRLTSEESAGDEELEGRDIQVRFPPFSPAAAQDVLGRIAWWLHQEKGRISATVEELAAQAEEGLALLPESAGLGLDGQVFIGRMRDESGLLAMTNDGDGKCGFLHLSFQEYLAADFAATEGKAKELAPRITDSWWREPALLSLRSTRLYSEEFFKEVLKAGLVEQEPGLVDRCLNETAHPSWDVFLKTLSRKNTKPERKVAILRLLRSRSHRIPKLQDVVSKLVDSEFEPLAELAREVAGAKRAAQVAVATDHLNMSVSAVVEVDRQPGTEWIDTHTGITYVWIPPGKFLMGSAESEKDRYGDEGPQHEVKLTSGFWLARYPVTNEQYGRYMESAGGDIRKPEQWGERRFNLPQQPVVGVSWEDAVAFTKWASDDYEVQLPTEAQWEYACRAGTTTRFYFGDDASQLGDHAWFDGNSSQQTQPVGMKLPNEWGLYDMHGNVLEW
ncbi:MAG: SUMF1/EgtB/PvdO family nonheme iron enzyme, partial [Rhodopirellula sp.]|nr:SUMF1/EgtB/PvdO family nonheme iron enzyme [Rhodopirellula sp.]